MAVSRGDETVGYALLGDIRKLLPDFEVGTAPVVIEGKCNAYQCLI